MMTCMRSGRSESSGGIVEPTDDLQRVASARPPGSRIEVRSTRERFLLQSQSRGPHLPAVLQLIGGMLCLAISGQWTRRALAAHDLDTAFVSLPFWLIGIAVALGATFAMVKHHRMEIGPESGWIRVLPLGLKRSLRTGELQVRFDHVTRGEADGRGGVEVPVLVIEDSRHAFRLLEGFSGPEHRWIRAELNIWLARHGRR